MSPKLAAARRNIEEALMRLERDWTRDMRFTCVVRSPTNPEGYCVVTSDPDLEAVAEVVRQSAKDDAAAARYDANPLPEENSLK